MGTLPSILLVAFLLLMTAAPVLVRVLERRGFELAGRLFAWVGDTWMGLLFLFVTAALVMDLYRLAVRIVAIIAARDLNWLAPSPRLLFIIAAIYAVIACIYGFYEALAIRSEHVTIETDLLPRGTDKIRVVQISDVHVGLIVREGRLRRILSTVKEARPDILVSTGDLVDGQLDNITPLSKFFREVEAPFGKYAVTGNHEFYAGLDPALAFTAAGGFTVLRGSWAETAGILIAGVDDPAVTGRGGNRAPSDLPLLQRLPPDRFVLLLKHRPELDKNSLGLFSLQLSGHVHRGQIFPFVLATRLSYPLPAGLNRIDQGAFVYVSRGSGTWGPPIRFFAPPEVTVVDIIRRTHR
jgi:predicted MPP superfamily phosphohydrolase